MSVRQYIGARYVPRFVGIWNNTTQYDALDVVDNGSGTSYIARVNVPAGTPLTDTDFWFIYGASSGAIIDLQNRVGSIENDLPVIESDVETLQNEVDPLINDVYVMVGDSFGARTGGWINYLKDKLGLTEGSDVFSTASGGSGWCNPNTFLYLLNLLAGNMTAAQRAKVTKVVTVGGVNDTYGTYSQSDIATAVTTYCNRVAELFPNLKEHYIAYNCTFVNPFIAENVTRKALQYRSRSGIIDGIRGSQKKVAFIGGLDNLLENTTYIDMTDGVHPNSDGELAIGFYILNAMNNGLNIINSRATAHGISYQFNTGNIRIQLNQGDLYSGTAINIAANTYTNIYTDLSDLPYYPRSDIFILNVPVVLIDTSNVNHSIVGTIRISTDGKIRLLSPEAVSSVVRVAISGNFSTTDYYN